MKLCGFDVGLDRPLFLIAGPCVVESEQLQMEVAGRLKEITGDLGIHLQVLVRQGEPQLRQVKFSLPLGGGPGRGSMPSSDAPQNP